MAPEQRREAAAVAALGPPVRGREKMSMTTLAAISRNRVRV